MIKFKNIYQALAFVGIIYSLTYWFNLNPHIMGVTLIILAIYQAYADYHDKVLGGMN
jgi:membrane-bound ClpP family serine protease